MGKKTDKKSDKKAPKKADKKSVKAVAAKAPKKEAKPAKALKSIDKTEKPAVKATPSMLGKAGKLSNEGLTPEASLKKSKELAAKVMTQSPMDVLTETPPADPDEIILTDAEGRRYCRARDCDQLSRVDGYCRYHYLLFWKKIQVRKKILSDGKLERYIEELTAKFPDKYLEVLRKDLRSEKDFMAAIGELELEEAAANEEADFEEDNNFIEEMRGVGGEATTIQDDDDY